MTFKGGNFVLVLVAMISWCGIFLQFWISVGMVSNNGEPRIDGLVAYFGYFTILTNIFVALASTTPLIVGNARLGRWFGKGFVLGCATTAILLAGIVYHVLLRHLWNPTGLQLIADMMLHYMVPFVLFMYWIFFAPTQKLSIWAPLAWCIYPIFYLLYVLARGEILGVYPYPFIDVVRIGYYQTIINSLGLLVVYILLGGMVYAISVLRSHTYHVNTGKK